MISAVSRPLRLSRPRDRMISMIIQPLEAEKSVPARSTAERIQEEEAQPEVQDMFARTPSSPSTAFRTDHHPALPGESARGREQEHAPTSPEAGISSH